MDNTEKTSMMFLRTIFFAFTLICCCASANKEWLKYDVFSNLPQECKPQSCSVGRPDQVRRYQKCDCDEACSRYGTCCIDSPYATTVPTKQSDKREQCSKVYGSSSAAFMVSTCNPRWHGEWQIRRLCETIEPNVEDPLTNIPVTNPISKITYKNYFCSVCNFCESGGILWNVLLTVLPTKRTDLISRDRESILHCLQYDGNRNSWGIWKTRNDNVMDFIPIAVSADMPSSVRSLVKDCDATITESRCATTWNDEAVRIKCESYLSPITLGLRECNEWRFVNFRNPHCAVCNYVNNFEEAFCTVYAEFGVSGPGLSFTLLVDFNPSDGNKVGESNRCSTKEVYDPFFKTCRSLGCAIPGYILKDERCVKA